MNEHFAKLLSNQISRALSIFQSITEAKKAKPKKNWSEKSKV